ncbi:MAG: hypothetical protein AAFY34_13640 [Pseudomonadota bacterium]
MSASIYILNWGLLVIALLLLCYCIWQRRIAGQYAQAAQDAVKAQNLEREAYTDHIRNAIQVFASVTSMRIHNQINRPEYRSVPMDIFGRDLRGSLEALAVVFSGGYDGEHPGFLCFPECLHNLSNRLTEIYSSVPDVCISNCPRSRVSQDTIIAFALIFRQVLECAAESNVHKVFIKFSQTEGDDLIAFGGLQRECVEGFLADRADIVHTLIDSMKGTLTISEPMNATDSKLIVSLPLGTVFSGNVNRALKN